MPSRRSAQVRQLLGASHPQPSFFVTAMAAALATATGHRPGGVARVAAAVWTGQLSVGWCNDWLDAGRDATVGRTDKPVAAGAVDIREVRAAALAALAVSVAASARLGAPGRRHLVALASAWLYDAGLKSTVLSWLPYAVSFGLLPRIAAPAGAAVPRRASAAAALLGVGAHLANALPDLDDDLVTGVDNAATRLGRRRSRLGSGAALLAGTALLTGVRRPAFGVAAGITAAGLGAGPSSRRPFTAAMAVAALDVALLVGSVRARGKDVDADDRSSRWDRWDQRSSPPSRAAETASRVDSTPSA